MQKKEKSLEKNVLEQLDVSSEKLFAPREQSDRWFCSSLPISSFT